MISPIFQSLSLSLTGFFWAHCFLSTPPHNSQYTSHLLFKFPSQLSRDYVFHMPEPLFPTCRTPPHLCHLSHFLKAFIGQQYRNSHPILPFTLIQLPTLSPSGFHRPREAAPPAPRCRHGLHGRVVACDACAAARTCRQVKPLILHSFTSPLHLSLSSSVYITGFGFSV